MGVKFLAIGLKRNISKKVGTKCPPIEYFIELQRITEHQIIFGANHFIENIPNANASCWIFWDKDRSAPGFSDGEMAWTNFGTRLRKFYFTWNGFRKQEDCDRIHPTEKPVQLYKWLLKNYAKPGDTIFDSHMGSQSSRIACYEGGFDFFGCELDKDYFDAGCKRFEIYKSQLKINFD